MAWLLLNWCGMSRFALRTAPALSMAILVLACAPTICNAEARVSYLYNLSNFFGTVPFQSGIPFIDRERHEVYVINPSERGLSVFNEAGMEVHRFDEIGELGNILDGAVDEKGSLIFLLVNNEGRRVIQRCNYRGEPLDVLEIKNLPKEYSDFSPDRMLYRNGRFYFANRFGMKIVVADSKGIFHAGYDIGNILKEEKKEFLDLVGFGADKSGNIYFTVPVIQMAYRISPDGKISGFGKGGSIPGAFGVVVGIEGDDNGNIFVVDSLKSAVMVFDNTFKFLAEFGYLGDVPGSLNYPKYLAVDDKDRIYVSQAAKKGISVFQLNVR
jgi:hypothetical protein